MVSAQHVLVSQNPCSQQKRIDVMKKILVVDNHPLMLKFMTNLLERNGHWVPASSSEALKEKKEGKE